MPPGNPTISSVRQLISRSVISFRYTPQTTTFSASRHQAVTVKYKPLKLHSTVYKSLSLNSLFLSLNLSLSFHFPENKKKFPSLSLSRIHSCRYVITFSLLKVSIFIVKFLIFFLSFYIRNFLFFCGVAFDLIRPIWALIVLIFGSTWDILKWVYCSLMWSLIDLDVTLMSLNDAKFCVQFLSSACYFMVRVHLWLRLMNCVLFHLFLLHL